MTEKINSNMQINRIPRKKKTQKNLSVFLEINNSKMTESQEKQRNSWNSVSDITFDIKNKFHIDATFNEQNCQEFLKDKNRCLKVLNLSDEIPVTNNVYKIKKYNETSIINKSESKKKLIFAVNDLTSFTFREEN